MSSGLEQILSRVVGDESASRMIAANRPAAPQARTNLSNKRSSVFDRAMSATKISRASEHQALKATMHTLAAIKMSKMATDTLQQGVGAQTTKTLNSLRDVKHGMKSFDNHVHNIKHLGSSRVVNR